MTRTTKDVAGAMLPEPVQRVVRQLLFHYRLLNFKKRIVTRKIWGHELSILINDPIAAKWYDHDVHLPPVFRFLEDVFSGTSATVFYLGAHYGVYAMAIARILDQNGNVIALEANPYHANTALENCRINGCISVEVINAAIGNDEGEIAFTLGHRVSTGQKNVPTINVPMTTIDELVGKYGKPELIILDVEGYEQKALEGARKLLADENIFWCIESHIGCGLERFGGTIKDLVALLSRPSVQLLMGKEYGGGDVEVFDISSEMARGNFQLLRVPSAQIDSVMR